MLPRITKEQWLKAPKFMKWYEPILKVISFLLVLSAIVMAYVYVLFAYSPTTVPKVTEKVCYFNAKRIIKQGKSPVELELMKRNGFIYMAYLDEVGKEYNACLVYKGLIE